MLIVLAMNSLLNTYAQAYNVPPNGSGANFTKENPEFIAGLQFSNQILKSWVGVPNTPGIGSIVHK
jgi:hypothetical protein